MLFVEDRYRQLVQPILDEIRPVLKEYLDPSSDWNSTNISSTVDGFTLYLARAYHLLHSDDMCVTRLILDNAVHCVNAARSDIRHAIHDFRRGNSAWCTAKTLFDAQLILMVDPALPKDHPSRDDLIQYIRSI